VVAEVECEPVPRASAGQAPRSGFSLAGLIRELLDQITTLFRQELRLARAEMTEKAQQAGINAVWIVIGGAVAFVGALALVGAACAGLWAGLVIAGVEHHIAVWLAPLIVGGVLAIIGWALIQKGIATLKNMTVTPDKTTDSLKETARWMQHKVS
jgi:hypothetical protein